MVPTGKETIFTAIVIHRVSGGKIAEEWSEGSALADLTQQRLKQERRERARVEQELRVANRIQQASLPRAVPKLEGFAFEAWLIAALQQQRLLAVRPFPLVEEQAA